MQGLDERSFRARGTRPRYAPFVAPERLLRIAALYHGVLGLVLLLSPRGFFGFLKLEMPRYMLFYALAAVTPVVAGVALEVACRRLDLRPGLG